MRWVRPDVEDSVGRLLERWEGARWPDPPPGFEPLTPPRPMRQVLRGRLPDDEGRRCVVKWSWPASAADRVSRRLRGGKGPREGRLLRRLAEAGIPVPRPLGYADEGVDLLVLEDLGDLDALPTPLEASPALVRAVARLLGAAFGAGLRHRDLHRGNVALRGGVPVLLDLGGARLGRGRHGRLLALARARHALLGGASRAQLLRALRAWTEAAGEPPAGRSSLRRLLTRVEARARRVARRHRRGRDRRATRTGRHYEVFRLPGGVRGVRSAGAPAAWKDLAPSLGEADPPGARALGTTGRVVAIRLPGLDGEAVLKRYGPVLAGRLPRPLRDFRRAAALEHRGIDVPRPLLAFAGPGGRGALLSRHVEGTDLHRFVSEGLVLRRTPSERRHLARALGGWLRRLHEAEVSHRDLKAPNVLLARDASGQAERFVLCDLEGARVLRGPVPWSRAARDLARLEASLDLPGALARAAFRAWWAAGPPPPVPRKRFLARLLVRARKKRASGAMRAGVPPGVALPGCPDAAPPP